MANPVGRPREEDGDDAVVVLDDDNAADDADEDDVFAVADGLITWTFPGRKSSAPGIIARLLGCSR